MFSTAIFITVCAKSFSGVAWGNLQDDQENKDDNAQFPAGFVVIDMSGAVANDMDLTDETIGIGPFPRKKAFQTMVMAVRFLWPVVKVLILPQMM